MYEPVPSLSPEGVSNPLMSSQNTHHIPAFDRVFISFYLVISTFIVVYLILGFLCISSEQGDIWKLCGDWKKEFGGELSLNIAMFIRRDVEVV